MELSVTTLVVNENSLQLTYTEELELLCSEGWLTFEFQSVRLYPWLRPGPLGFAGETWRPFVEAAAETAARLGARFASFHSLMWEDFYERPEVWESFVEGENKSFEIARILGAETIIYHPLLCRNDRYDHRRALDTNLEFFRPQAERAGEFGLTLAIENAMFLPTYDPEKSWRFGANPIDELTELCDELSITYKNVGLCLDTGHARCSGVDVPTAVRKMGKRLHCLHIHDNDGTYDGHLFPGEGIINWAGFTQSLADIGYRGILNFESITPFRREVTQEGRARSIATCYKIATRLSAQIEAAQQNSERKGC